MKRLFLLSMMLLVGCASTIPKERAWHAQVAGGGTLLAKRDIAGMATGERINGEPVIKVFPIAKLPPFVAWNELQHIKRNDSVETLAALTQPQYPVYFEGGAVVRSTIHSIEYEVAYLYYPDKPGIIMDVSLRPIAGLDMPTYQ